MKLYDREIEAETLRRIEATSGRYAQLTVITGRRRIGKTTLIKHAFEGSEMIYFFVARKSEALLCQELTDTIRDVLGEDLGDFSSMARLFAAIMQIARRRHFTLVFDEFQNFKYVNESFFSDMQNIWDSNKDEARINLIVCGSLYSMMTKIFDDRKEPLYGRATSRIRLREFPLATLREIMLDNNPDYAPDDLLALYMMTGGVAKYVEQLHMAGAFTKDGIINMRNKKWEMDFSPIEADGASSVDTLYTKAYLRHLFHAQELLAMQIASIHNLAFYLWLVGEARKHIIAGDFSTWKPMMVKRVSTRL